MHDYQRPWSAGLDRGHGGKHRDHLHQWKVKHDNIKLFSKVVYRTDYLIDVHGRRGIAWLVEFKRISHYLFIVIFIYSIDLEKTLGKQDFFKGGHFIYKIKVLRQHLISNQPRKYFDQIWSQLWNIWQFNPILWNTLM